MAARNARQFSPRQLATSLLPAREQATSL